jgi:deoxyribodipyrimidine photo-lyase
VFIFDKNILEQLKDNSSLQLDKRVIFIYQAIEKLKLELIKLGSDLVVIYDEPLPAFRQLLKKFEIKHVYTNHDYEPYAIARDEKIKSYLAEHSISFHTFKDQCIFEKNEVVKKDGTPYTVFTPYRKKWLECLTINGITTYNSAQLFVNFLKTTEVSQLISLHEMGFEDLSIDFPSPSISLEAILKYGERRDFPALEGTSRLGIHLRFGIISIRKLLIYANDHKCNTFVNELIWRDFYMMILFQFPYVANKSFKSDYDNIQWLNDENLYNLWCEGRTGYPIIDAGMRELNATGYMHNRVRMIVASFLVKDLLVDWRWGESYFAKMLLDFEMSSNNGGWQWAAGCGCDAAPYFRVFNPELQAKKFDPQGIYIRKWIPEFDSLDYPIPIINHAWAKERTLKVFSAALKK